jgi:predicted alpha/beta-hydrolase family hydrolase
LKSQSPSELHIDLGAGAATSALVYRSESDPGAAIILGHGAGADQRSTFMVEFAEGLAGLGFDTVTFNFLYTERRKRIPDRRPILEHCYRAVIDAVLRDLESARRALFVGGKSMGGRIATHVAAEDPALLVKGLILLGYPLHPPNRPDERRDAHLPTIRRPMLFMQGSRDVFGTPQEFDTLIPRLFDATFRVVDNGDHSFKLPGRRPAAQASIYEDVRRAIAAWVKNLI